MTVPRVLGVLFLVLAVLIAVIPYFNNCGYDGRMLTLANGNEVSMKCFWTSRAALVVAVPLGVAGIALALSKRKETGRVLSILGIVLGAFAILLPTSLIGVCSLADMSCRMVMLPALEFLGGATILVSVIGLVMGERRTEQPAV